MNPFAKIRKPCSSVYQCGRRVHTLAYVRAPMCQPCRRRWKNLLKGHALNRAKNDLPARAA